MARKGKTTRAKLAEQVANDAIEKEKHVRETREEALTPNTQYAGGSFSVPLRGESSLRSSKAKRLKQTHHP